MKRTSKGNYTFRIDDRTYVIRVYRGYGEGFQVGNVVRYPKTWNTQTTYIAAGGGRVARGEQRQLGAGR